MSFRVVFPPRGPMLLGWLSEHCETGPHCSDRTASLLSSFRRYCDKHGEFACSNIRTFRRALIRHGFTTAGTAARMAGLQVGGSLFRESAIAGSAEPRRPHKVKSC